MRSAPCGLALNRIPTRSSPPPPSWQKRSVRCRMCRQATGNSPVKPAPKRWWPRWALLGSGMAHYALAIGMDTAQGRPGDQLEYTAGAGGAAFLIGPAEEALAEILCSYSYVTDTPDFWRREYQKYPEHGQRFTGEPAYFKHITEAGKALMEETNTTPADYQYAVFHQPNTKFPQRVARHAGLQQRTDRAGLACAGDRQHLRRGSDDRSDRRARHRQTRRQHPDGFLWLGRRLRCLCHPRHRSDPRSGRSAPTRRRITSPGARRSITAHTSAAAASWR